MSLAHVSKAARIGVRGTRVALAIDGLVYEMSWEHADGLAAALRAGMEGCPDDPFVRLELRGRSHHLPRKLAEAVSTSLVVKARAAEEVACAEQVALDAAILLRAGAPFGLTDHPAIRAEAAKEAAWNSDLRRYMPGGVRGSAVLGAPTLRRVD